MLQFCTIGARGMTEAAEIGDEMPCVLAYFGRKRRSERNHMLCEPKGRKGKRQSLLPVDANKRKRQGRADALWPVARAQLKRRRRRSTYGGHHSGELCHGRGGQACVLVWLGADRGSRRRRPQRMCMRRVVKQPRWIFCWRHRCSVEGPASSV